MAGPVRLCDRRLGPSGVRVRGVNVGVAGPLGGLSGPRWAGFRRSLPPLRFAIVLDDIARSS